MFLWGCGDIAIKILPERSFSFSNVMILNFHSLVALFPLAFWGGFGSGTCRFDDLHHSLEIVSHHFERQFQLVLSQPQVTHPPVILPFLQMGKDTFDMDPYPALLV